MSVITIRITVPDGATVEVEQGPYSVPDVPQFRTIPKNVPLADFENEPLPPEPTAFRGAARATPGAQPGFCPVHNEPWKTVPAGVSKRTGKPYEAFLACPTQGCNEKPR